MGSLLLTACLLLAGQAGWAQQDSIRQSVAQQDSIRQGEVLQEVTVTSRSAQKRIDEVQIGVERVDMATLSKIPALFGEKDILKSIQLLPGVKSEGDGSGGYQVRGGTSAQNIILLDGGTVYNAGHLMGLFSSFNDDALNNASLYKGLIPAQLGGATSSVFDISTRMGDMQAHHFSATVGLLSAKLYAEGPMQRGRSSFLVAARRSYLDMFMKAVKKYKDNTLNFYDANVRLNFRLSDRDMLALTFFRSRDNMGVVDLMDLTWDNTTASADWLHTFSPRLFANTQFIYSNFGNHTGFDLQQMHYMMNSYIRHLTLHEGMTWMPTDRHKVNFGLETTYLQLQSADWEIYALKQRERRSAWMSSLWVNDEWTIGPAVHLSAGLRLQLFSALGGSPYYQLNEQGDIVSQETPSSGTLYKTYAQLEPRVSINWKLNDHHTLKLGYSHTTQHIQAIRTSTMSLPFDRYTMSSNIIHPQVADQVAVGWMGITDHGHYDFSAEAYYKAIAHVSDYRDGKTFNSEIEMERLLLEGKGRAYGLELCARKNTGRLTGWVAYTLSWSENKIPGINGGQWYTAANDRRHDMVVVGMYTLSPAWELAATWRYNTGQALTAPSAKYEVDGKTFFYFAERNGYRAPAYHRLDLSATYTRHLKRTTHVWAFGIYNAYSRYNPFVVTFEEDKQSATGTKASKTALFGLVPSVSFTVKF